jgi:hypothetical protein
MTVLERKVRFVRAILDEDIDENNLHDLEVLFAVVSKQKSPCQYSVEELNSRAEQGIKDAEAGLGKSMEEMRKKYPLI